MAQRIYQYVGEKWRWGRDFSGDMATGVTITASTWSADPTTGLILTLQQVSGSETSVLVEAQVAGTYLLVNQVSFSDGEVGYAYLLLEVGPPESVTSSPFPSPEELLVGLPAQGDPLTAPDAKVVLTRWINSLEFQPSDTPTTPEEKRIVALAVETVEAGALATLERDQLLASGRTVQGEVYARISNARTLRKEYNDLRTTEADQTEAPMGYLDVVNW